MKNKKIREALQEQATEKEGVQIPGCAAAFSLAEKFDVTPREIGQLCNEEKIRICSCQLGLFQ